MGGMEVIKSLILDLVIVGVFYFVVSKCYKRSYRVNLLQLLIQLVAIMAAGMIAFGVMKILVHRFFLNMDISSWIPASFYYVLQPYMDELFPFFIFTVLFVLLFVLFKSILYVFSMNYEWEKYLFPQIKFNRKGDYWLSGCLSAAYAYTYVLAIVFILSFPLFGIVGKYSVSQLLLHINPVIGSFVDDLSEPYYRVQKGMRLFGDEIDKLYANYRIDLEYLKEYIDNDPAKRVKIQSSFEMLTPLFATPTGYLGFFEQPLIDKVEMSKHLRQMKKYIDEDVLTLEFFNSYYKELICNGTYDKLIEDQIINDEALELLMQSSLLNDDNLKKLKNI